MIYVLKDSWILGWGVALGTITDVSLIQTPGRDRVPVTHFQHRMWLQRFKGTAEALHSLHNLHPNLQLWTLPEQ